MKTGILNRLKKIKKNEGMTLIEIMIVVTIMAILIAFLAPKITQYMDMPKKARVQAAKKGIENIKLALLNYSFADGKYPTTDEGLDALVRAGLLKEKDLLDPWGNKYQYVSPGEHDVDCDIYSYGADGKEGGEGFDADITSWE